MSKEHIPFIYRDPFILFISSGMTRQQILQVPRHSFAPLTRAHMRFFNVSRREQRRARRDLWNELEPRYVLRGTAGLNTPMDRDTGFNLASLPANRTKRSHLEKKNPVRERWIARLKQRNQAVL